MANKELIRLKAKESICAEFSSSDIQLFALILRRSPKLNERMERLFRCFITREARYPNGEQR